MGVIIVALGGVSFARKKWGRDFWGVHFGIGGGFCGFLSEVSRVSEI